MHIFEKNLYYTIVCSEVTFSRNSYHIETSQMITLQINWAVYGTERYFGVDFRILLVLYDLNSLYPRVLTKCLTSWNTKNFPQNLRYRQKETPNTEGNIKDSKL